VRATEKKGTEGERGRQLIRPVRARFFAVFLNAEDWRGGDVHDTSHNDGNNTTHHEIGSEDGHGGDSNLKGRTEKSEEEEGTRWGGEVDRGG